MDHEYETENIFIIGMLTENKCVCNVFLLNILALCSSFVHMKLKVLSKYTVSIKK